MDSKQSDLNIIELTNTIDLKHYDTGDIYKNTINFIKSTLEKSITKNITIDFIKNEIRKECINDRLIAYHIGNILYSNAFGRVEFIKLSLEYYEHAVELGFSVLC